MSSTSKMLGTMPKDKKSTDSRGDVVSSENPTNPFNPKPSKDIEAEELELLLKNMMGKQFSDEPMPK